MSDSINRFSNRVETYVRARPAYPYAVLACLVERYGLGPIATVADVGAGAGSVNAALADGWLHRPCHRTQPRASPRLSACWGAILAIVANWVRPEATGLPDHSIDFVTGPGFSLV